MTKKVKDKKLRGHLQKMQKRFGEAAYKSAQSDILLLEDRGYLEAEGMEKTYKFTQEQIRNEVDITTAQKVSTPSLMLTAGLRTRFTRFWPVRNRLFT